MISLGDLAEPPELLLKRLGLELCRPVNFTFGASSLLLLENGA